MTKVKSGAAAAVAVIVTALFTFGCGPGPQVFAQRMNSGDVAVRREAAKELRGQPRDARLVPVILQACRDQDLDVRVYAYYAIGRVDAREEGVVGALIDGMADTSVQVRRAVTSSMGSLDPFPNTCLPHLVRLLVDPDEKTRRLAFSAVADMGRDAMGSLMRNIDSRDAKMRLAVINVLAQIGEPAKSALAKLRQIARDDESKEMRDAAEKAVRFIEN
ncbi:MAG: HEAT repeat domain-containing protein [Chitinispirillales bacterium]|jgi:HEAT repeat protein|nr:HEAT repeat domain-containing protein [Chitinispirillales bacterium]